MFSTELFASERFRLRANGKEHGQEVQWAGNREAQSEAPEVKRTPGDKSRQLRRGLSLGREEARAGTQVHLGVLSELRKHPKARTTFGHFDPLNLQESPRRLQEWTTHRVSAVHSAGPGSVGSEKR